MKERLIGVMVLSAVVSAAFTAVWVLFVSPRGTALAVGRVDVLLDFVFVDDESGQPIAGASLDAPGPRLLGRATEGTIFDYPHERAGWACQDSLA